MHGGFVLFSETHTHTLFPVYLAYTSCVCAHKSAAASASDQSHVFTSVTKSRVTVWMRKREESVQQRIPGAEPNSSKLTQRLLSEQEVCSCMLFVDFKAVGSLVK